MTLVFSTSLTTDVHVNTEYSYFEQTQLELI